MWRSNSQLQDQELCALPAEPGQWPTNTYSMANKHNTKAAVIIKSVLKFHWEKNKKEQKKIKEEDREKAD